MFCRLLLNQVRRAVPDISDDSNSQLGWMDLCLKFPCKRPTCINVEVWRVTILTHFAQFCFYSIIVLSRVSLKTSSFHDIFDRQDMRQYEALFQCNLLVTSRSLLSTHLGKARHRSQKCFGNLLHKSPCRLLEGKGRKGAGGSRVIFQTQ